MSAVSPVRPTVNSCRVDRGVHASSPGTTLSVHSGAQDEGEGESAPARLLLRACQQLDFLPSLLGESFACF